MSSRIKLKSCPFCGGDAKLLIVGKRPNGEEEWYVACENLNCSLHPHSSIPYASAEIAAEAWNRRAENTRSVPDGGMAAMREALEQISLLSSAPPPHWKPIATIMEIGKLADAALSAPLRNCDVGTAEEQESRFGGYCANRAMCDECRQCFEMGTSDVHEECVLKWAQMPYEEGGSK